MGSISSIFVITSTYAYKASASCADSSPGWWEKLHHPYNRRDHKHSLFFIAHLYCIFFNGFIFTCFVLQECRSEGADKYLGDLRSNWVPLQAFSFNGFFKLIYFVGLWMSWHHSCQPRSLFLPGRISSPFRPSGYPRHTVHDDEVTCFTLSRTHRLYYPYPLAGCCFISHSS